MSGDIGRGATRETIAFAVRLAAAKDRPHGLCKRSPCLLRMHVKFVSSSGSHLLLPIGFLQLAGGTNAHTVNGLKKEGLFQTVSISGTSLFLPVSSAISSLSYSNLHFFSGNSKDQTLLPDSSCSAQALIAGIAYGGYARKVSLICFDIIS